MHPQFPGSNPPQPDPNPQPAPGPESPPTEPTPPGYLGQERQPQNAVAHVDADQPTRSTDDLQAENARLRGELEDENARLRDRLDASRAEASEAQGLTDEDVRRIEYPEEFAQERRELAEAQ